MHLKRIELTNYRQHRKMDVDFEGNLIAILGKNGCLAEGTPVRLFDGTVKPVEEVKRGDVLMAFDDATGQLTPGTVSDMIRTSPSLKPKPMLEVELNGEKTCTTYDHPFFAGDGFYPLYQLVWGALEECQRTQLKLLCEQYGAPFDDTTIWQQNSCRDEACAHAGLLQDHAGWAYREGSSGCGGSVARESAWTTSREPYRLQSVKQQGGEPGVVQREVQCVVWGNPWKDSGSTSSCSIQGGAVSSTDDMEGDKGEISVSCEGGGLEDDPRGRDATPSSGGQEALSKSDNFTRISIKVVEAATYYTIRMREAPYAYCIGRRNCYLTHNSGKSNLIGAIQFALTGEQPGFTKADLTTWGEKEGSVKLTFTAGSANEEFVIVRKTNGDVTLKVGGETIKQARKVEDALRDKAGLDKELIRQIVFVPQKGIDAILFDDPKNREVAFQRLIGIGNASKIYEALGREITALDKPQGFDEAIARSRQQLAEQNNLAKTCREALVKYEDAIKALPSKESLEKEVDKCAGAQAAVEDYIAACNRLTDAEMLREVADKKLENMGVPPDSDEELLARSMQLCNESDAAAGLLAEGKEAVRYLTRLKELSAAAASAKEEFGNAEQKFQAIADKYSTTLEEDKAEMDMLTADENAAAAEARSLRNLAKEASSDGTCPVCGAPASQEDIAKHLEERVADATEKYAQAAAHARQARMDYDKRHAEQQMACQAVEKKRTAYDIALDALRKAHDANVEGCSVDMATFAVSYKGHTPDDIPDIEKRNSELTARIAELAKETDSIKEEMVRNTKARNAAKDARDYAARQAAQVDMARQSKEASAKRLSDLGIDPESVSDSEACRKVAAKARANLEAYNGILRDMAAEKGKLESVEATLENTKRLIDDLENKKELEGQVKEKVDTLKRVRDWFHYREGPRIMSQNVMRDLTACVNNYLDQFCAPFIVEATEEGFGFKCRFIDGRTMPEQLPDASMLSGGQKVALAIAFRLAVYMCFGGELGLLSLDEPTAYLDHESIGHLGEVLEQVRQVARNKGLQILMATHEPKIIPYLDGKIDLNEMKGE